jgi:hypothetical protein
MRPAFLLLGAQKSGTTALFNYLCACSDVAPPERFELHYFDNEFWRGFRWYLTHFPRKNAGRPGAITGEKSPYYLFHPQAPLRVLATLPDCRFLVLLRDPVARAYSHFRHSQEHGFEKLASFEEAIDAEQERLEGEAESLSDPGHRSFAHQHYSYLARSVYADQLERWLTYFPLSRFLVLQSERLFGEPDAALAEVSRFLGLRGDRPPAFEARNVGSYSPLPGHLEDRLRQHFQPHNERLFTLLGTRFTW